MSGADNGSGYKRVLLKLSGEALMGDAEFGISTDVLEFVAAEIRKALDHKVKISIGTDSHAAEQLGYYTLGVGMARRGWARKKDIVNTYSISQFKKFLKR